MQNLIKDIKRSRLSDDTLHLIDILNDDKYVKYKLFYDTITHYHTNIEVNGIGLFTFDAVGKTIMYSSWNIESYLKKLNNVYSEFDILLNNIKIAILNSRFSEYEII